jgi:hypothetical protein
MQGMPVAWLKHRLGDVMAESVIQMQVILQVYALSLRIHGVLCSTHKVHLRDCYTTIAAMSAFNVMYNALNSIIHCTYRLS